MMRTPWRSSTRWSHTCRFCRVEVVTAAGETRRVGRLRGGALVASLLPGSYVREVRLVVTGAQEEWLKVRELAAVPCSAADGGHRANEL